MEEVFKYYKTSYKHIVYEVSNMGRIKKNGVIVQPKTFSTGYQRLGKELLHRIVAQLFIPNPDNKPEVDHINTDITDNRAVNLRWVTSYENSQNPISMQHLSDSMTGKHWTLSEDTKERRKCKKKNSTYWFRGKTWKLVNGKRIWMIKGTE